jgi:hypothetical protein
VTPATIRKALIQITTLATLLGCMAAAAQTFSRRFSVLHARGLPAPPITFKQSMTMEWLNEGQTTRRYRIEAWQKDA